MAKMPLDATKAEAKDAVATASEPISARTMLAKASAVAPGKSTLVPSTQ